MEYETFGDILQRWRIMRKMTQRDLGIKVGVSANYISLLENGRRINPSREVIERQADALNLASDYRIQFFQLAGFSVVSNKTPLENAMHEALGESVNTSGQKLAENFFNIYQYALKGILTDYDSRILAPLIKDDALRAQLKRGLEQIMACAKEIQLYTHKK